MSGTALRLIVKVSASLVRESHFGGRFWFIWLGVEVLFEVEFVDLFDDLCELSDQLVSEADKV